MKEISPLKIGEGIHWVGALDPELRVFDVIMETKWGTTYNSFYVEGREKKAIIEMVKDQFGQAHLDLIRKLVDPREIDYIVINHTEPDHSGSLARFLKEAVNATVVVSRVGYTLLKEIVNGDFNYRIVGDGDTIDLGGKTLSFINAPFLHWPDSMFTYIKEDKVLFPGDVFGCHYCDEAIFEDAVQMDFLPAQRYYFDVIMSPFKNYMLEAIGKIKDLPIEVVCPGHGPILRKDPWAAIHRIEAWSKDVLERNDPKKVFIAYVSAYGNTRRMGEEMARAIQDEGLDVEMLDVSENPLDLVIGKVDKADGLLFGSPTINRDVLKPVWDVLTTMSVFKNRGKLAAAFGSYGWSGEGVGMIEDRLKSMGVKISEPGLRTKLIPNEEALKEAYDFGRRFAQALKKN